MSLNLPGYKILRTLGRGGMATVYLAIQEVFEREVALKVMSKVLAEDPNFNQRFFREAKIVSKLVHPNIVTVHDVGVHDGYCYLSMEYIDGKDLKCVGDKLNLSQKIRAIRDIAKALDYAGAKGYVHRDIKLENIMFHSNDGRAVLMDFGIARAAESDTMVTQVGTAIGTPHYMSPEQAKGKTVDTRSDIYSLGVVFFSLLAGYVPYDAESAVAIGIKHITEPVPQLPKAYRGLQHILDRMMAKTVTGRYQNAQELIDDIDALDVEALEHAAEFVRQAAEVRNNANGDEMPTLSHVDEMAEAFEVDDDHISMVDAFPDYDMMEEQLRSERSPILPWLLAGSFVICVVTAFLYYKKPELVKPFIDKAWGHVHVYLAPLYGDGSSDDTKVTEKGGVESHGRSNVKGAIVEGTIVEGNIADTADSNVEADTVELGITGGAKDNGQGKVGNGAVNTGVIARDGSNSSSGIASGASDGSIDNTVAGQDTEQLGRLLDKLEQLIQAQASDDLYLSELVVTYREAIELADAGHPVHDYFDAFRAQQMRDLLTHAQKVGSSVKLDTKIKQLQTLFPEEPQETFNQVTDIAKVRKRVISLILEAEAYTKQRNLTKPSGRNALDSYDKALALDPENPQALAGKKAIAEQLAKSAMQRYNRGQWEAAKGIAERAIAIDPSNQSAAALVAEINQQTERRQQVSSLLSQAEKKINRRQLFLPEGEGAFDDLQQVLAIEPSNAEAKQGLSRLVDALSAKVWQMVGDQQFLEAKAVMRAALSDYGDNARVQSIERALDEVVGEKVLDVQPRVDRMMVRGEAIVQVDGNTVNFIEADRSIFLGFRYSNFQTTTAVVQAVLMDGAKRVQISQVPVVLEGTEGESRFRIDRPVEGFPAGSYSVDLRFDNETLQSIVFKVK